MLENVTVKTGLAAAALLATLAACGGGGGGSTPTNPTPTPTPNVNACAAISQTASATTAITNGADCSPDNTSVMRLNMEDASGRSGSCSGTVIAPRVVLTAAHCLDDGVKSVLVWRGAVGEKEIPAISFKGHPSYSSSKVTAFDVGVVFVGEDLNRPIIPILTSRDGQVGETAVVAGWGQDLQGRQAYLRAGTTTLSAVDPSVLRTQFSATSTGICYGDSGGPILLSQGGVWAVAGIISATSGNTCNTGEHFYAAVRNSAISSFIRENVSNVTER